MKASTLFAITIAVLLGLGVVAAAKYSGIFNPREKVTPPPPEPPKVLVAALNLFEGTTITPSDVRVRPMRPEEEKYFQDNPQAREQLLPPLIEAGALRVLKENVEADKPISREHLRDLAFPDPLNRRVGPNKVAINVDVPAERAAGGLIQSGERVDVYLTTKICSGPDCKSPITQTAPIARNLKVIVKRNTLWTAIAPIAPDKPIPFTLEANPYRAALIEFAKTKGDLTLVPTSAPQELDFNGKRPANGVAPAESDESSKEYRDEDERISKFLKGEITVGEADLERIFNLRPIERIQPIRIERVSGNNYAGAFVFGGPGANGNGTRPNTEVPTLGYQFSAPSAPVKPTGG